MSIPTIYFNVINGLLQKSLSKEVIWDVTTNTNVYVVYFEDSSLTLHYHHNEHDDSYVSVDVINDKGDKIDGFWVSESEGDDWNTIYELFSIARRSALSIDNTIQGMLKELDKKGQIGQKRKNNNTDDDGFKDDIPF